MSFIIRERRGQSGDTEAKLGRRIGRFLDRSWSTFLSRRGFFIALRGDREIEQLFPLEVLGAVLWAFFFGGGPDRVELPACFRSPVAFSSCSAPSEYTSSPSSPKVVSLWT